METVIVGEGLYVCNYDLFITYQTSCSLPEGQYGGVAFYNKQEVQILDYNFICSIREFKYLN